MAKEETIIPEFTDSTFTNEELVDKIVGVLFPQYNDPVEENIIDLSNLITFKNYDLNIKCMSELKDLKVYNGFKRIYYTIMDFLINDKEIASIRFPLNITEVDPNTNIYPEGLRENLNREILNFSDGRSKRFCKKNLLPIVYQYVSSQKEFKGNFKFISDRSESIFTGSKNAGIKYFTIEKLEMVE